MKEDHIENLFKNLQGHFNTEEPAPGHQQRFLERLSANGNEERPLVQRSFWIPLSIAASVLLVVGLAFGKFVFSPSMEEQIARISPEAGQTQFYFANLVEEQVKQLEAKRSPETEKIIGDALGQLQNLEKDYRILEKELLKGGNGKLILNAMITNFQTRINLLQTVLTQIDTINSLNNNTHENYSI